MNPALKPALDKLLQRHDLELDIVQTAFSAIMDGECEGVEIAALLTALAVKGESETEIAGAAQAMRARACRIPTSRTGLLDTCGTGGDNLHTLNVSTIAALITAGAGLPVAKHGNRSITSKCGSADLLEAAGVNIVCSPKVMGQALQDANFGFAFAPIYHGAMKYAIGPRRQIGVRTLFNMLGPLTNPAGARHQLLGVFDGKLTR
ncbi:MAG: anthranilate phosphoribosyltransferase, partial [Planctomycetaceae bacterium]|nr:anthranilate phosphoribosyltransferase [Planctomycetaceae bacterium]